MPSISLPTHQMLPQPALPTFLSLVCKMEPSLISFITLITLCITQYIPEISFLALQQAVTITGMFIPIVMTQYARGSKLLLSRSVQVLIQLFIGKNYRKFLMRTHILLYLQSLNHIYMPSVG